MNPNVYIIAGPNGAGKTTFAQVFLPEHVNCPTFINADLIAEGVSEFRPESAAFKAGRIMLQEMRRLAGQGEDFGFETTLAGRAYLHMLRDLKRKGYSVHIFFLWVPSVDLSLSRIRERVLRGGHNVPETEVRRRFERSIRNFLTTYREVADDWTLFDNSALPPRLIAKREKGKFVVAQERLYNEIETWHRKS